MKPYEIPKIQEKLAILKDAILTIIPNTEAIYLFVSYANGTPDKYSDLDVFVVIHEQKIDNHDLYIKFITLFCKNVDRYMPIDLLFKTSNSFYYNINFPTFDRIILRTGIKLYG